jgi:predicted DNA-binding transcriptional regulator YafY
LTVLEILQSAGSVTGPELAARLEVDVRSVRRYITLLRDMGIPVDSDPGRYGAYYLRPGYRPPPIIFTTDEIMAVTLGLLAARQLGMTGATGVESASAKLTRVLPEELRERVAALHHVLTLDIPRYQSPAQDVLDRFSLAAYQQRQLWVAYQSSGYLETTERVFDAYGLTHYAGNWYAVGYCHLRQDIRTFRLDRVAQCRLLETTFETPADFNALDHLRESIATLPGAYAVEVHLRMPLMEARQHIAPTVGLLDALDADHTRLRCWSDGLRWISRFLINLGCSFTVIQPPEMRATLKAIAAEVIAWADQDSPSHEVS